MAEAQNHDIGIVSHTFAFEKPSLLMRTVPYNPSVDHLYRIEYAGLHKGFLWTFYKNLR